MSGFWDGKRVLVTGHTGFVGAWLCCALKEKGADVTGFSLIEPKGSLYDKIKGDLCIKSIYGDLRDSDQVDECISECNPEIVFHIAAFGFVKECAEDPDRAYTSNVNGTLNLLSNIRKLDNPCRIVIASSDKVYRNSGEDAYLFKEEDCLCGTDTYSASKTCEDILAQSYFDSYLEKQGCSMCIIRPSNILGGGDHNINRLVPGIYHKLALGLKPEIRNPLSVRPWQNIFDIVDAYLTVAESDDKGCSIFNVGPEETGIKTVGEIASYVAGLYNLKLDFDEDVQSDSIIKEKAYLGLSIDKIRNELGWKPKRSLEQTLDEIYEFYKQDNGTNTYRLCMSQIKNYYS